VRDRSAGPGITGARFGIGSLVVLAAAYFLGGVRRPQHEQDRLDAGDIDSALAAAAAVGDDTIQKRTQGYVVPETFTHGTAAQRQRWFRNGFAAGRPRDCDTFSARNH